MDNIISPQTALYTAKLASFGPALFLGGYCLSFGQATVPSLYEVRPQISTKVYAHLHRAAGPILPTLALLSTGASAYLAYAIPSQRREWTTAAVAMFAIFPWNLLVMAKGINRLVKISEDEKVARKSEQNLEHRQLLKRWVSQSYVMVALQLFSGVTGLMTVLKA